MLSPGYVVCGILTLKLEMLKVEAGLERERGVIEGIDGEEMDRDGMDDRDVARALSWVKDWIMLGRSGRSGS